MPVVVFCPSSELPWAEGAQEPAQKLLPANLEEALGTLETACDQPCSPL